MPHIIQLDPHLANLIAAGEVVERPASVAKELVENAVDAGARAVTVELQNGGMRFLRVTDDGCGMGREDAKTAFLRHATSKLRTKEDLAAIGTLGFRGEALAATAAVSRVDLLTRTAEDLEGTHLTLEAGKLLSCEAAGCPVGTTIVVRDLFFNTPARMKFMKRDAVEGSAAADAVRKQALAHPEISFRLIKDGELQLQTPGDGDLLAAVYAVLGRQAAGEMIPVDSRWENISVRGYVSRPTATRGNRTNQHFFVNRRYIRSRTLTAALEEAYRNQLMTGRFPSCVLNIDLPLTAVDVNVHPAKTEVKFLNEKELFDCVHYGVLGALNKAPGQVPFVMQDETPVTSHQSPGEDVSVGAHSVRPPSPDLAPPVGYDHAREAGRSYRSAAGGGGDDSRFFRAMSAEEYRKAAKPQVHTVTRWEYEQMTKALNKRPLPEPSAALQQAVKTPAALNSPILLPDDQPAATTDATSSASLRSAPSPQGEGFGAAPDAALPLADLPPASQFRYIGEVFRTYILVEQNDELILIDKHAAHERMNFERLLAQGTQILGQTLLQPLTCSFDREEAALLLAHRELLLSLGYDVDSLDGGDLLIRQIPSDIRESDAAATLSELADHLRDGRLDTPQRLRDEALHTIACKAAIKAGYVTDPVELQALAKEVLTRDDLKYCPHGRPICTVITKRQMEKQFKRIT